jgi:hypothetical protein
MDKWEYLEVTLVYSPTDLAHGLEAVVVDGKRRQLAGNLRTRTQVLDHYGRLGWTVVKSYSDVYTLKRTRTASAVQGK